MNEEKDSKLAEVLKKAEAKEAIIEIKEMSKNINLKNVDIKALIEKDRE